MNAADADAGASRLRRDGTARCRSVATSRSRGAPGGKTKRTGRYVFRLPRSCCLLAGLAMGFWQHFQLARRGDGDGGAAPRHRCRMCASLRCAPAARR